MSEAAPEVFQQTIFHLLSLLNESISVHDFFEKIINIIYEGTSLGNNSGLLLALTIDNENKLFSRNLTESEEAELLAACRRGEQKNGLLTSKISAYEQKDAGYIGIIAKGERKLFTETEQLFISSIALIITAKINSEKKDMVISTENDTRESAMHLENFFASFPTLPLSLCSRTILDETRRLTRCDHAYACMLNEENKIMHEALSTSSQAFCEIIKEEIHKIIPEIITHDNIYSGSFSENTSIAKNYIAVPVCQGGKTDAALIIANAGSNFGTEVNRILLQEARLYSQFMRYLTQKQELERQNAAHASLLQGTWDLIFTLNQDGEVLYISPSVEKLGYSPNDFTGHSILEFVPEEDRIMLREKIKLAAQKGKADKEFKFRVLNKKGEIIPVEQRTVINKTESGAAIITGIIHDLTAENSYKKKVHEKDIFYKSLFMYSPAALFIIDPVDFTIQDTNAKGEKLLGLDYDSLIGKSIFDFHLDNERASVKKFIKQSMLQAKKQATEIHAVKTELIVKTATGKETPVRFTFSCLNLPDKTMLQAILEDLSKEQNSKVDTLKEAKENLSAKLRPIAHDFNNIFTVINGYAALLNEQAGNNTKLSAGLTQIIKAVDRATKLNADFQNYARNPSLSPSSDAES